MEKQTLSSNVQLDHESKNREQFLLASQSFGTFYCIYGKFDISETGLLSKIEFRLINYKGICNVGFFPKNSKIKLEVIEVKSENLNYKRLVIKIPLIGFSGKQRAEANISNAINDHEINFNEIEEIIIFRGIIKNDFIDDNVFDSEFNYRDGEGVNSIKPLEPQRGRFNSIEDWDNANFDSDNLAQASSINCMTSVLYKSNSIKK